jgi:hypothetical protein
MTEETRIALRNYDWLIRNRREIELAWDSDTLVDHSGGYDLNLLCQEGFTPATSGDWRNRAD